MTDPRLNPEAVKALETREAIVRKGMRLQIATELLAGMAAAPDPRPLDVQRKLALEQADALIRENEVMP